MTRTKRLVSVLLVIMMLMQTVSFAVPTQTSTNLLTDKFVDFPQDWAKDAMTAAVENGIINGTSETTVEPDKLLTRAELATMITRIFGATVEKKDLKFTDVSENDWFYSSVAKAVQMGAMEGTSDTTFAPNDYIRREDMFLTIARIIFVSDKDTSIIDTFSDSALVDTWAKEHVSGLLKNGYLHGYEDNTLRPKNSITRAEVSQVFFNLFGTYISEGGSYSGINEEKSLIIRAKDVKLTDSVINGDLILADGIGNGNCVLENVQVKGRIIVRGGEGLVTFKNVKAGGNVIINDPNGVVNFNNYSTEDPFNLNIVQNTPATFLEKPTGTGGSTGGIGGGGKKVNYTVQFWFEKTDGSEEYEENVSLRQPKTATKGSKVTASKLTGTKLPEGYVENEEHADRVVEIKRIKEGDVLKRYYKLKVYDVVFENADGSEYAKVQGIKHGFKIPASDIPADLEDTETQMFKGWAPDGKLENKIDFGTYVVTGSITLKPIMVDKQPVTVRFLDSTLLLDKSDPDYNPDDAVVKTLTIITGNEISGSDLPDGYDFVEEGFYKDPSWSDAYASLSAEELQHIINYNWWYQKDGEWKQYEDGMVITEDTDFYYGVKAVTINIRVNGVSYPLTLAAPYETDTRALDTLKDLIFMNGDILESVFEASGVEDNLLGKFENKNLIDASTRQIKNINEMRTFSSIMGKERFTQLLNDRLKHFYEPGEDYETIQEFLINYIKTHSEDEVVTDITPLINHLIENDHDTTRDMLYDAVAQIVETNPDLVLTYLQTYVNSSRGDSGKLASLKTDLNNAFVSFRDDYPTQFVSYIEQEIKALLSSDNADVKTLVTDHIVQSIKDGEYSNELTATISGMGDTDLKNLVISVIDIDYSIVESELETELSNTDNALFNVVIDALKNATSNKDQIDSKIVDLMFDALANPAITKNDLQDALDSDRDAFYDQVKTELGASGSAKTSAIDYITNLFADDSYAEIKNSAVSEYLDIVLADANKKSDLIEKAVQKVTTPSVATVLEDVISETVSDIISDIDTDDTFVSDYCESIKNNSNFNFIIDIVLATDETTTNEIISDLFDSLLAMGNDGEVLIEQIIDDFVDKMIASDTIDEELVRVAIRFIKTDDVHGPVLVKDLVDNLMHVDNIIDFAEDLGFVDASDGRLKASLDFIKQITNNQTFDVNTDNLFVIEELLTYIKTDLAFDSVCQTYFEPKVPEQIYVRVKPLLDKIEPIYTRTIDAYIAQIEVAVAAAEDNGTTTAVDSGVTIQLNPVSELLIPVYDTLIDYYDKANQKVQNSTNKIGQLYSKFYVENEYIDDIISLTRPEKWLNGSANDYTDEFSGYSITEFEDWYENIKALVVLADDLFVWYCENVDYEDVENAITSQEDRIINYSNLMCGMLTDFAENGIPESITDIYNNLMDNAMFENDLTNADGKVPVELQAYIERFAANATIGTVYLKVLERFGIRAEDLIGTLASSKINKTYTSEDIEKSLEKIEFGMQDGNKNYTTDYVFDNVIGDDYADVDAKGNSIEIQRAVKDSPLGDVVEPIE